MSLVACTHCHHSLQVNGSLPAGVDLLCPHCKKLFKVAAPAPTVAVATKTPPPVTARPHPFSSPPLTRPQRPHSVQTAHTTTAGRFVVAVLAGLALACVGAAGVGWLLVRNREPVAIVNTADPKGPPVDRRVPQPPTTPAVKVPANPWNLTSDEASQIEDMKRKGMAYLRKTQNPDGTWPSDRWSYDLAAMGGLTMLECGIPLKDPAVQKCLAAVRQSRGFSNDHMTYGIALQLLFLDKVNDPVDRPQISRLAAKLMKGQLRNGGWAYALPEVQPVEEKELMDFLGKVGKKTWKEFAAANRAEVDAMPASVRSMPIFSMEDNPAPLFYKGEGDNSNSQFAMLALWAARRQKIPVDLSLHLVVKKFARSQEADGRWDYSMALPHPIRGASMTCAGLLAIAIGHSMELPWFKSANPQRDPAVLDALSHLAKNISAPGEVTASQQIVNPYYLWSVERVGVLFNQPTIGGKDWYRWGIRSLKFHQKADGSWTSDQPSTPISDVCFALLFMNQVNLTQDLTDKLQALHQLQEQAAKELRKE